MVFWYDAMLFPTSSVDMLLLRVFIVLVNAYTHRPQQALLWFRFGHCFPASTAERPANCGNRPFGMMRCQEPGHFTRTATIREWVRASAQIRKSKNISHNKVREKKECFRHLRSVAVVIVGSCELNRKKNVRNSRWRYAYTTAQQWLNVVLFRVVLAENREITAQFVRSARKWWKLVTDEPEKREWPHRPIRKKCSFLSFFLFFPWFFSLAVSTLFWWFSSVGEISNYFTIE